MTILQGPTRNSARSFASPGDAMSIVEQISVAAVTPVLVRKELEIILQSAPFRTSKQCQDMLRYVVEHSLRDEQESLRERVIGIEVFGRSSDYDTSIDPVVRIRAADIRKRLAQYYQHASDLDVPVQIEIPSGSYRAVFTPVCHMPVVAAAPEVQPVRLAEAPPLILVPPPREERPRRMRSVIAAACVVLVATLAGVGLWRVYKVRPPSALDSLWAPVFASHEPVIIYAGANAVYRLSDQFLSQYRREHHVQNNGPEFFVTLPPSEKIAAADLVPVGGTTADGQACALFVALISRLQRSFELRYGSDISVGDLQNSPTILVGGFNNPWALKISGGLRFVFRDGLRIEDSWHKLPGWSEAKDSDGTVRDDYALISRIFDSHDGHVLIMAGGIGSFGTQAAAEFLTNPKEMAEFARKAPPGWQQKNLQIVLHVGAQDLMPSSDKIVAIQAW